MRSRLLSLNQVVESEAVRLGLSKWEVINIIENGLERRYLSQNRYVHIRINANSDTEPLVALEGKETYSGLMWVPMTDIRPPHPDLLQRDIEDYVKQKNAERNWWLAMCEILEEGDDFYLVEVKEADEQGLVGKNAVLPFNRLTKRTRNLSRGQKVWAVLTQKTKARYDGAEAWVQVDTDFVASRTDSIFLKMLVKKYWHLPVECDITNDAGLVVLPTDTNAGSIVSPAGGNGYSNLGSIIGPKGEYVKQLQDIAGLNRIVAVRRPENKRPDMRLANAIKQIVGIDSVRVRVPLADTDEWRLRVSTKDAPVLIGKKGTNLRFISVLTGLRIKYFIRDGR